MREARGRASRRPYVRQAGQLPGPPRPLLRRAPCDQARERTRHGERALLRVRAELLHGWTLEGGRPTAQVTGTVCARDVEMV